jgi:hypothetical protein
VFVFPIFESSTIPSEPTAFALVCADSRKMDWHSVSLVGINSSRARRDLEVAVNVCHCDKARHSISDLSPSFYFEISEGTDVVIRSNRHHIRLSISFDGSKYDQHILQSARSHLRAVAALCKTCPAAPPSYCYVLYFTGSGVRTIHLSKDHRP